MKTIKLFYFILLIMLAACTQDDDPFERIVPKPAGKYLSEIRSNIIPLQDKDSTKIVTFEYNKYRYLTRMNFYNDGNGEISHYSEFFYNSDGLLDHITSYSKTSNVIILEKFTYENKKLTLVEGFKIENNKKTLVGKTTYQVDAANNVITFLPYDLIGGELVEKEAYQKYYFNSNGNLSKYHYNIGRGGFFETMEDFEYDNMNSPFSNFEIPFYNVLGVYFYPGEFFSKNNVIKHKDYLHENGVSYLKASYDTIIYKYEDNYPIESAEYKCYPNFPIELQSQYFYKYVNLK